MARLNNRLNKIENTVGKQNNVSIASSIIVKSLLNYPLDNAERDFQLRANEGEVNISLDDFTKEFADWIATPVIN